MDTGGPVADDIASLTIGLIALGGLVYVAFVALLVVVISGGRTSTAGGVDGGPPLDRNEPDETGAEPQALAPDELDFGLRTRGSRRLVVYGGLVLPAVLIAIVFAWTLETMVEIPTTATADALTIEVTASQWRWDVHYPGADVTVVDELYLPTGRPIAIELRSTDVIHSFWVRQLGGKLDAVPDRPNLLILEADEAGDYTGRCAEFCGLLHSEMDLEVTALAPDDFDAWLAGQARSADEAGE